MPKTIWDLPSPPPARDHAGLAVFLASQGFPELGADHLLNPLTAPRYSELVGQVVRRVGLLLRGDAGLELARNAVKLLVEVGLNSVGFEAVWAGVPAAESEKAYRFAVSFLGELEEDERVREAASAVVKGMLSDMGKVMSSNPRAKSMLRWMSEEIERQVDWRHPASSFLAGARRVIEGNAYYRMYKLGLCRFGNDYALGLRWLRRLGFVQVSTNPVLAAEAYKDDPGLWEAFEEYLRRHPELVERAESDPDELAMAATLIALWPNMEVFRPVAHLLDFKDGMISYQLNPNVADSVEGSVRDALKIYRLSEEYFEKYDEYLLWGWPSTMERGRPNIVFKVAGSSEAAIEITRMLESMGIGTNNTVTFAVSQEVQLILAKLDGRAKAVKKGVKLTKSYETNMGGRLEAHLREVKAAELIKTALRQLENPEEELARLARELGVQGAEPGKPWEAPTGWGYSVRAETLDEKAELVASQAYVKSLKDPRLAEFLLKARVCGATREEVEACLAAWEEAISLSGTLVARRVWGIFFSDENMPRWIAYLVSRYGLSYDEAVEVLGGIDVLPASKRKPEDTLYTLAARNMTNTEFPNHQLNVHMAYASGKVRLEDYANAVLRGAPRGVEELLVKMEDFRKAYELTEELLRVLREVGIPGAELLGSGGLKPEEWVSFGPRVKTMKGFTNAYNEFRSRCLELAKRLAAK